jgi:hypothetical protein
MIRSFFSYFPKIKGIKLESSQDSIGMVMFAARHDIKKLEIRRGTVWAAYPIQ